MKKFLLSCAVMAFAITAFAQTSNKNESTAGLFNTDVDNFIDVNGWSTVNPPNFFGYLGYNSNIINYGMSHQFKSGYGAFYFDGLLSSFTLSSSETKTNAGSSKTNGASTDTAGMFDTAFLFGKGDMSFKAEMGYISPISVANTEQFTISPVLSIGLNNKKLNKWNADYSFGLGYVGDINKTDNGTLMTDNSKHTIELSGKAILEKENKSLNQELDLAGDVSLAFAPVVYMKTNTNETKQHGDVDFNLSVTPDYILTFNAAKNLVVKGSVGGTVSLNVDGSRKYTETNGTKTYETTPSTITTIDIEPTASVGISYTPTFKKIKFPIDFNAGASINIPTSKITFNKNEVVAGTGEVTSTTTGASYKFISTSGDLTLNSGVTITPVKNVTIDASCNLISHIFGTDFETDFTEGNTINFWNTVNQIFVHNVNILVSVKL